MLESLTWYLVDRRLLVILALVFAFIEIDGDQLDESLGVDTDI